MTDEYNGIQVAAVTGATGKIGRAIARQIATLGTYEVVLICRDKRKAEMAVREIRQATGNDRVRFELADLSRKTEIQALADKWRGPLHVLVNNAAATPLRRLETPEGIELQFATNVLGYVWMIQAFSDHLKQAAPARVVNVASYWAGGLLVDDLEFKHRHYDNGQSYRQSKQANRMLSVAFAEQLKPYNVSVNACHPGDVDSALSNNLGFGGHETPDEGASTPVWLATSPEGQEETGRYFEQLRQVRCLFGENQQAVAALYEVCLEY